VLYYSGRLFKRLGVRGTVLLGYGLYAARWGVLAVVTSPLVALFSTLAHGLTFGAHLAGSIAYVEAHTPPGLHATAQGVLTAAGWGLGAALGALGGGLLFEAWGGQGLFAAAALAALLAVGFVAAAGGRRSDLKA
jgi:PPP family 3-phenylpropionic acid transporter